MSAATDESRSEQSSLYLEWFYSGCVAALESFASVLGKNREMVEDGDDVYDNIMKLLNQTAEELRTTKEAS